MKKGLIVLLIISMSFGLISCVKWQSDVEQSRTESEVTNEDSSSATNNESSEENSSTTNNESSEESSETGLPEGYPIDIAPLAGVETSDLVYEQEVDYGGGETGYSLTFEVDSDVNSVMDAVLAVYEDASVTFTDTTTFIEGTKGGYNYKISIADSDTLLVYYLITVDVN
jgi:cytoskeletal protein RodZ